MHAGAHGAPPLLMPPGSGTLPPLSATLQGLHAGAGLQGGAGLHGLPSEYGGLAQPIEPAIPRSNLTSKTKSKNDGPMVDP